MISSIRGSYFINIRGLPGAASSGISGNIDISGLEGIISNFEGITVGAFY